MSYFWEVKLLPRPSEGSSVTGKHDRDQMRRWTVSMALITAIPAFGASFPSKHRSADPTLQLVCTDTHSLLILMNCYGFGEDS